MRRTKHLKTEYDKLRKAYRPLCNRHVVTFESDMSEDMKRAVFRYSDSLRKLGNQVVSEVRKRMEQMFRTKQYRTLQKDYGWHRERMKTADPSSVKHQILETELKKITAQMEAMQKEYHVTWEDVRKIGIALQKEYQVGSIFALTRCEDIWRACQKILFSNGKHLHFRKRFQYPIIRAKQAERGIPVSVDKEGNLRFSLESVGKFGIHIPKDDRFLQEEAQNIVEFLTTEGLEEDAVKYLHETGVLKQVFRPCYAALKCELIRGKLQVFVQVTVASKPVAKKRKDGSARHAYKTGYIGCDIGTQSFAAVSSSAVILENLSERDGRSTKRSVRKQRLLQQRIDRSIRITNPERFEADGTPKKIKGSYRKSKHCRRMQYLLREQYRRDRKSREYAIRTDANMLRSLGDVLITEQGNAKAWQKRSRKPTEQTEKQIQVVRKDGTTHTVQKCKKKKRFGRSVFYRCPGRFQAVLKEKFGSGYHEVARNFRASQYDHVLDAYIKKKLSERWHILPGNTRIQRDIYSAFLLFCSNEDYSFPDRNTCIRQFDSFLEKHNHTIQRIIRNHYSICNSGITA